MGNAASGRQIPLELVQRIERRLKTEGPTSIAESLGLDPATVRKVKRGAHPQQQVLRAAKRCGGCGGKIVAPEDGCLKCAVEGNAAGLQPVLRLAGEAAPPRAAEAA